MTFIFKNVKLLTKINREVNKMVEITNENLAIFVRKNRERNVDVERKMMINLMNALKDEEGEVKNGDNRREVVIA